MLTLYDTVKKQEYIHIYIYFFCWEPGWKLYFISFYFFIGHTSFGRSKRFHQLVAGKKKKKKKNHCRYGHVNSYKSGQFNLMSRKSSRLI